MSVLKRNLSAALIAAVALCGVALPLKAADAQLYFGFGPAGFGVGIAPPPPMFYPPYYAPYYPPAYYSPMYYPW